MYIQTKNIKLKAPEMTSDLFKKLPCRPLRAMRLQNLTKLLLFLQDSRPHIQGTRKI